MTVHQTDFTRAALEASCDTKFTDEEWTVAERMFESVNSAQNAFDAAISSAARGADSRAPHDRAFSVMLESSMIQWVQNHIAFTVAVFAATRSRSGMGVATNGLIKSFVAEIQKGIVTAENAGCPSSGIDLKFIETDDA